MACVYFMAPVLLCSEPMGSEGVPAGDSPVERALDDSHQILDTPLGLFGTCSSLHSLSEVTCCPPPFRRPCHSSAHQSSWSWAYASVCPPTHSPLPSQGTPHLLLSGSVITYHTVSRAMCLAPVPIVFLPLPYCSSVCAGLWRRVQTPRPVYFWATTQR